MASFILRAIDPDLWARVQAKAAAEGISVKALILKALAQYVAIVALLVLTSACAYQNPTYPTPITVAPSTAPAAIRLTTSSRPDFQTSVTATVYTADQHRVPNAAVAFTTAAGTLTTATGTTDANGTATTIVNTPTTTMVSATIGALSASVEVGGAATPTLPSVPPILAPPPPEAPTPTAVLGVSPTGQTGVPLLFGVSAPSGQTWLWTFGDGASVSTSSYTVLHTYASAGIYAASVSSAGTRGANATVTISDAPPPPPVVAPSLSATITCTPAAHLAPTPCNLSSVTYGGAAIASGAVTNVDWDWGDGAGSPAGGTATTHTYTNAGTYTVLATVTANTSGGSKTTTTSKAIVVP